MARSRAARAKARPDAARWEREARKAIGDRATAGPVPLLVGPSATPEADFVEKIGFPGAAPYTRGIQPTMYRGRVWTFRQYSGFGSAKTTNERFRFLLDG
ncbi:MAG TPA: methylmalonyl-CoA mutase family protein, partial [Thermoplasmata archaeon]|nr:methylmalonyl-CoA mutase family protein [Thermoplasmata archaeon]